MTRQPSRPAAVRPPRQARSRATEQRLFDAASDLFAQRGLDDTGVADIVEKAGTGIGTFYGRFRNKDAFAEAFCRRFFEAGRDRAFATVSPEKMPARSVEAFADAYATYRIAHYQRDKRLLRAVVTHMRRSQSLEVAGLQRRFASEFLDVVFARVHALPDGARVARRDIAIALTLVEAVLKDLYLAGGGALVAPAVSWGELHEHLTRIFLNAVAP
ncbi:MAG TPA: TetR/AcrR family transcriptional regulator [Vicinamibacterales bacterium]